MMKKLCVLLLAIALIGLGDYSSGGVIKNGEFTVDLTDWDTDLTLFDAPTGISEVALFVEPTTGAGVQLAQTFTLPTNALKLSFEYNLKASVSSVVGAVPDNFQATLFTSTGDTLFPSNPSDPVGFPAFFSVDNTGVSFFDSSFVTVQSLLNGNQLVTLNLASILATYGNEDLTIDFLLNGNVDGFNTTVALDNVVVTQSNSVIPEPSSVTAWLALLGLAVARRQKRSYGATLHT